MSLSTAVAGRSAAAPPPRSHRSLGDRRSVKVPLPDRR